MKKSILYLLLAAVMPIACSKENLRSSLTDNTSPTTSSTTIYTIQTGNHYCDQTHVEIINKPAISALVTFDSSGIYQSLTVENQSDVNKLIGFSDCGTDHQENSARLGWSWNGKSIVIYAYAYNNKERIIKTLGNAPMNRAFSCSVRAEKGQYYFSMNNINDSIPRHCSEFTGTHYKLFPYFGGDEVAPHDIRIIVEETNP